MGFATKHRARYGRSALAGLILVTLLLPGLRGPRALDRDLRSGGVPLLVSPLEGEKVVSTALRLSVAPVPGTTTLLLLSDHPFTAEGMRTLPTDATIRRIAVTRPVLDATDLGVGGDTDQTWYWAVAALQPDRGTLTEPAARISATRQFTLTAPWRVAAKRSPWVLDEAHGHTATPLAGDAASGAPTGDRIRLAAGFDFDPLAEGLPQAAQAIQSLPVGGDERPSLIVQFDHSPTDADREALLDQGLSPVAYLPDNAYVVRGTTPEIPTLGDMSGVRWVGDYAPAFRLSPRVDVSKADAVTLVVQFFGDADLNAHLDALKAMGGTIVTSSDNGINKLAHVTLPANRAGDVARLSGVAWVEPFVRATTNNDVAQWIVQTAVNGNRRIWTMGIDGTGQVVNTTDSGVRADHDQFRDPAVPITTFGDYPTHRKIIAYKLGSTNASVVFGDHSSASYHGTHTAGTICGNDGPVGGTSLRDGMAPGAKLFFMDLSGPALANGIDHFADLNDLFIVPYTGNAGGAARISSNSWGGDAAGAYDISCLQVDQFMWAHKDFLIFFSNGNAGTAGSVGSPASAKSICSAGGTRNTAATFNQIYTSTSRGPTADGRRKPTICSPGQAVFSANGAGTTGYVSLSGTSMASPSQAGAAALIRQYMTDGWYPTGTKIPADTFTPSAALLKAMCVNSADNNVTGFTAPDNNIGWGRIDCDNVCYFNGDTRKLIAVDNNPGLGQGDYIEYTINVTSSAVPLEVSLCWTDYPGIPAAAVALVNNLNLTVSQGATVYKGNVYASGVSTTGGAYDVRNVEEGVLINTPATGIWTVRIDGAAVPYGPQPFGLVLTGGLSEGAGTLYLDRAEYPADGTLQLKIIDTNAGPTLTVHVTSQTEPAGEDVTLTGTGGVYTGSLRLSPYLPGTPHAPGALRTMAFDVADDTLRVSHGDALSASYLDASPAATLTAGAFVALERPLITNVLGRSNGSGAAAASWTTDINATSRVYYGLTPALELGSVADLTYTLSHDLALPGSTGQTLYFDVESAGLNGNSTRDDNGGQHYKVTLDPPADILLVIGDASFDRLKAWQDALSAAGWSYDTWTGALSENPLLGSRTSGLRSYKAVLWQAGFDQYPPFSDTQRTVVSQYLAGGGRIATVGHDIAWALGDATSPYFSATRSAWLAGTLHTTFNADPTTWTSNRGIAADPISGAYTAGVTYTPIRSGGAGDEIDGVAGAGTFSYDWRNNEATIDDIGFRWTSLTANGSADSAQWGGQPSRLATMYFEWSAINPPFGTPNAARTDILDKTIIWLLGRDRPDVAFTFPVGGETVTADSITVSWTETAFGGTSVVYRHLDYSLDAGASWTALADSVPPSPYIWQLGSLPNSPAVRLRLRITDDGAPQLTGQTQTPSNFAIQRPAADILGPIVAAGSIVGTPNPFVQASPAQLAVRISDLARGGQNVTAAEWSRGAVAAVAGSGTPISGAFGAVTVNLTTPVTTKPIPAGLQRFWLRGRDAGGNWGPASSCDIIVNVGAFADASALCPSDSTLYPGGSVPLAFGLLNGGTAADSLRFQVTAVPGGHTSLTGGPFSGSLYVAAGDTGAVAGIFATATASAPAGEVFPVKLVTWPKGDPTDRDSCTVSLTVRRAVALVACPGDTTVQAGGTLPLVFTLSNTGNRADSLHYTLVDQGPGPLVYLTGGNRSGTVWLDPAGSSSFVLPGVTVTGDVSAPNGQTARLRLITFASTDPAGADTCSTLITVSNTSGVGNPGAGGPLVFAVQPNQPNPFSAATHIRFSLPQRDGVTVRLFSLDGQLVRTLLDGSLDSGRHEVAWDGADAAGRDMPAGLYFYRVSTSSGQAATGRMMGALSHIPGRLP